MLGEVGTQQSGCSLPTSTPGNLRPGSEAGAPRHDVPLSPEARAGPTRPPVPQPGAGRPCSRLLVRPPYHGRQAGNVFDRVLDLLFGHLHQCAVLILRRQRLGPVPRDPGVQLQRTTGRGEGQAAPAPQKPWQRAGLRRACGMRGRGMSLWSGGRESQ